MICFCITTCRSWSAERNSGSKNWETHQNGEENPFTASQVGAGHNCADGSRSQLCRWEQVTAAQVGAGHTCTVYRQELAAAAQAGAGQNCTDRKRSQFHRWEQVTAQLGTSRSCTLGSSSQVQRWEQVRTAQVGAGHNWTTCMEQVTAAKVGASHGCTGWSWTAPHLGIGNSYKGGSISQLHRREKVTAAQVGAGQNCAGRSRSQLNNLHGAGHSSEGESSHGCTGWSWTAPHLWIGNS